MTDKQRIIRMIIAWACIIVWGIFAVVLSRQDGSATAELSYGLSEHTAEFLDNIGINIHAELLNEIIRKIAHIVIYFVLGGLLYYALAYTFRQNAKQPFMLSITFCLLASSLDELQKIFIPGRHCDPEEILLNCISGVIGIGISYFFCKHTKH